MISAVGHEIDISIADLVADVRAATPSAAAEAAVPVRGDLVALLRDQKDALRIALQRCVADARYALECAARNAKLAAARDVERRRAAVALISGRLNALSPLATLARGYAVAQDPSSGRTLSGDRRLR